MKQQVVQLGTMGKDIAGVINTWLGEHPGWKVSQIHNIEVQRNGGSEKHLLVVFEEVPDSGV